MIFQTVNKRLGKYELVPGGETIGQTAGRGGGVASRGQTKGLHTRSEAKVTQSCPTLCDPVDSAVHGILQARILEWVAFCFFGASSQPRDQTQVSHVAGRFFTS